MSGIETTDSGTTQNMTEPMNQTPTTVDPDLRAMMRDVLGGDMTERLSQAITGVKLDKTLWRQLSDLGLTSLTAPEAEGGSGASWLEAAALLGESAAAARHLPLAETDLLAGWLLRTAGLPVEDPTVPRTVALLDEGGAADSVPWLQDAERVVVVAPSGHDFSVVELGDTELRSITETAPAPTNSGQQRAHLRLIGPLPAGTAVPAAIVEQLRLRGALARAAQCVGAIDRAVDLCIEHTSVRVQFGRPLARFQAVQQLVADAAAQAALARAAVDAAVLEAAATDLAGGAAPGRVAVARSCVGHAASVVVRNAHQVHGAIGTTQEHPLQLFTLPVLDWRSEFGTTRSFDRRLGELLRRDPTALWDVVLGRGGAA
ncbi:acyl-CoA dehydrogenase family protein [Streptomyces sp. NPDC001812]|uniref:Acyl-CoA/acyl-ACP dehydrogenase n=1 Tax=Streptomyces cathayae TaxID=3031124 RepID=A0ABY8K058_9ACTN|nr:acyl-CoA/acyl-ACP dehydrogenase [Streptomyces sp. HUAS 5]WGD39652.1 acyl-CoA/acyl-ACP dehydrogenase [Streptomyces sp. HUAS 5]